MRYLLVAFLLLAIYTPSIRAIESAEYCAEPVEVEFLVLLNQHRAANGAGPVVMDQYLGTAAEHHTMLEAQYNMLFHNYPEIGFDWGLNLIDHGFTYTGWSAEITAGSYGSPTDTLNQFKGSPPHNEGMIDPKYNTVGISRYDDGGLTQARYWWVIEFTTEPVMQPAILCGSPVATSTPGLPTNTPTAAPTPTPKACPTRNPKYPTC